MSFKGFLKNLQQRIVLNGHFSSWTKRYAGIPQGSILGLLLFLAYISNLPNGLQSSLKRFDDDTSLLSHLCWQFFILYCTKYHQKHCQSKQWSYKKPWMSSTMENEF